MASVSAVASEVRFPISVEIYHRMVDQQVLGATDRVELIEGVIVQMSPHSAQHARVLSALTKAFRVLGGEWAVRCQLPLTLARSEPEPDLVVCPQPLEDAAARHPTTASLVVEVASSSLALDRAKAGVYAEAGIAEYWIVDVEAREVEVYREPQPSGYRSVARAVGEAVVTPVAVPGVAVGLVDLFRRA